MFCLVKHLSLNNSGILLEGNVQSPAKNVQSPAKNVQSPAKNVQSSAKNVQSPVKNVQSPVKNVQSPVKNVQSPVKNVQSPAKNVQSPAKNVQSPVKNVQSPVKNVQSPVKNVQSPVKNVQSSAKECAVACQRILPAIVTLISLATSSVFKQKKSTRNLNTMTGFPWFSPFSHRSVSYSITRPFVKHLPCCGCAASRRRVVVWCSVSQQTFISDRGAEPTWEVRCAVLPFIHPSSCP